MIEREKKKEKIKDNNKDIIKIKIGKGVMKDDEGKGKELDDKVEGEREIKGDIKIEKMKKKGVEKIGQVRKIRLK